jgi:hypothetical protein
VGEARRRGFGASHRLESDVSVGPFGTAAYSVRLNRGRCSLVWVACEAVFAGRCVSGARDDSDRGDDRSENDERDQPWRTGSRIHLDVLRRNQHMDDGPSSAAMGSSLLTTGVPCGVPRG